MPLGALGRVVAAAVILGAGVTLLETTAREGPSEAESSCDDRARRLWWLGLGCGAALKKVAPKTTAMGKALLGNPGAFNLTPAEPSALLAGAQDKPRRLLVPQAATPFRLPIEAHRPSQSSDWDVVGDTDDEALPKALPKAVLVNELRSFMQQICHPQTSKKNDPLRVGLGCTFLDGRPVEKAARQVQTCAEKLHSTRSWPIYDEFGSATQIFNEFSTLFFGDSTIHNKWVTLKRAGIKDACFNGTGICYLQLRKPTACEDPFNGDKQRNYRADFDFVVYNFGMHYLEDKRSGRNYEDYSKAIGDCAESLGKRYPRTSFIFSLTNDICVDKWDGKFARAAAEGSTYMAEEGVDYPLQYSSIGTATMNVAAHELVRHFAPRWSIISTRTRDHCECTGMQDGRHFLALIPDFLVRLSSKLKKISNDGHSHKA